MSDGKKIWNAKFSFPKLDGKHSVLHDLNVVVMNSSYQSGTVRINFSVLLRLELSMKDVLVGWLVLALGAAAPWCMCWQQLSTMLWVTISPVTRTAQTSAERLGTWTATTVAGLNFSRFFRQFVQAMSVRPTEWR